jgi:hypothetical protein
LRVNVELVHCRGLFGLWDRVNIARMEGTIKPGDVAVLEPIEGLWGHSFELVALLPPSTPGGIFEAKAVGDFEFVAGHVAPGAPDVLLGPLMGEIVDADARQGRLEVTVVGEGAGWWLDGTGRVLRHVVVIVVVWGFVGVILSDASHRPSALARKSSDGRGAVQGPLGI